VSASDQFDPYREWLGIEPHEQPADHYRLLGLARFEMNPARIAAAADERMALVRKFQVGPRGRFTQSLLNDLAAAKVCLLSPEDKSAYDAQLARAMSAAIGPRLPPPPPSGVAAPPSQPAANSAGEVEVTPPETAMPWYGIALAITAVTLALLVGALLWRLEQVKWQRATAAAAAQAAQAAAAQLPVEPVPEPAAEPVLQMQEGNGEVFLDAATAAVASGVELRSAGTDQVLANWTAARAVARWQFRLIVAGKFTIEIRYATASNSVATELDFAIGDQSQTIELRGTGGLARVRTHTFPLEVASPGQHDLSIRSRQQLPPDWLELHSVRIIPVSRPIEPPLLTD
jgi:hypothetical protein